MITREDLRELMQIGIRDNGKCAVSFYFQPESPRNKAHREQMIQAKDMLREALREVSRNGNDACAKLDLEKIALIAEQLPNEASRAKAIFACGKTNFWREVDLPARLMRSQLFVDNRFHLKPLVRLLGSQCKLGIVLLDRQRARLFDLNLDQLTERNSLFHLLPRRGRSDGFGGYDGGRNDRHEADEALRHFKQVTATLKEQAEAGRWQHLVIGCQDSVWAELEPHLHPYVKQRLVGRFSADVATAKKENIRESASRLFQETQDRKRREMVHEAVSKARGHRHGVTGVRRVLRALELGEVRTVLVGESFSGHCVECTRCGHLDSHIVRYCSICGNGTQKMDDVGESLIPLALRRDAEIVYVDDEELDSTGNIAVLLRYRQPSAIETRLSA
jgi:peptide chain release factor subunit 1